MDRKQNDFGSLQRHVWALPFTAVMFCSIFTSLLADNTVHVAICFFLVLASGLPLVIERIWHVRLPTFIQVSYVVFLFLSMFSGEVLGMYHRFYPWDDIMHFISGLFVGLGAVLWLVSVIDRKKLEVSAWLVAMYVFCLGATVAVAWEVVEFTSDQLFGTFTQRNDLFDTMTDLMYGTISALIIAVLLNRALLQRRSLGMDKIIAYYRHLNRE
ncbi:MAG TPA: hypothetical protein VGO98_02305 [Candidatus Saccharimonadales bacterium]|jgi:uncharacterized membrane protein YjdF|nr:hypothetical protein [Candidatus Saccharimonadales bacterium]